MVKFKVYFNEDDLKEVNNTSLLFDSHQVVCDLIIGNIQASLVVNGAITIQDKNNDDIYTSPSEYPQKLTKLLKNGADYDELMEKGYIIDENNWFELFVDEICEENVEAVDEIGSDVAEIEGTLDNNNLIGSLFKFMANELKDFIDIDEVIDIMSLSGTDEMLLKEYVKNAYKDYKTLALVKNGVVDEQTGKNIYTNSNHKIMWVDMTEDSDYQILVEMEEI